MKILKSIGIGSLVFFIFYLLAAFCCVSFNTSEWTDLARIVVSLFGGMFSMMLGIMYYTSND